MLYCQVTTQNNHIFTRTAMISLPWVFKLNNYISYFLSVHRLFLKCNGTIYFISFQRRFFDDKYLDSFREMISFVVLPTILSKITALTSVLIWITLQTFSINHLKMFHGMNFVITSAGFRNSEIFRTVRSTAPFPSFVFYSLCSS